MSELLFCDLQYSAYNAIFAMLSQQLKYYIF